MGLDCSVRAEFAVEMTMINRCFGVAFGFPGASSAWTQMLPEVAIGRQDGIFRRSPPGTKRGEVLVFNFGRSAPKNG